MNHFFVSYHKTLMVFHWHESFWATANIQNSLSHTYVAFLDIVLQCGVHITMYTLMRYEEFKEDSQEYYLRDFTTQVKNSFTCAMLG